MRSKWGQNFLAQDGVARRIVQSLGAGPSDDVLEIGPGRGALTRFLVGAVKSLTVVELDRRLAEDLRNRWGSEPGVTVVQADFLDWPLPEEEQGGLYVIGNLPYSAAGPILRKILNWRGWSEAVVMVQREVARRISAGPGSGEYGILSLAVQTKAAVEVLFDVRPSAFRPPPQVVSTVLRLRRRPVPLVRDEADFSRVVHAAFDQRRKTLLNSLSHGLGVEKTRIAEALKACGLDPTARPETVGWEGFDRLSGSLFS
jgi:16S rRNA (adenine1518-N6/adenine1519-N6)-dimethyltransferase